jgi:hypothetical protein
MIVGRFWNRTRIRLKLREFLLSFVTLDNAILFEQLHRVSQQGLTDKVAHLLLLGSHPDVVNEVNVSTFLFWDSLIDCHISSKG